MAQRSKSNSLTFRSALSVYRVHLLLVPATDVAATAEEGERYVPIRVRAQGLALARVPVLGLVLDHGLVPHDTVGDAILTSLRGMAGMVEEVAVGSEPVEGVEEVGVVDIVKTLGLVLFHHVGALYLHVDDRRATSVVGTEGVGRGHPHTLCAPVAHGRDPTLVLVPDLRVLARGPALCRTLPTRDTVGAKARARAGVVRRAPDP